MPDDEKSVVPPVVPAGTVPVAATAQNAQPAQDASTANADEQKGKSVEEVAREVLAGRWSRGKARRSRLEAAGFNYNEVRDEMLKQLAENARD